MIVGHVRRQFCARNPGCAPLGPGLILLARPREQGRDRLDGRGWPVDSGAGVSRQAHCKGRRDSLETTPCGVTQVYRYRLAL